MKRPASVCRQFFAATSVVGSSVTNGDSVRFRHRVRGNASWSPANRDHGRAGGALRVAADQEIGAGE